jgi:hypothetical protein
MNTHHRKTVQTVFVIPGGFNTDDKEHAKPSTREAGRGDNDENSLRTDR